jgi:hypothetical protein
MTTMVSELYDALVAAGASEEKARKAAEAVASYDATFSRIDAHMTVLKVMVGGLYAIIIPMGWLLIRVASKVGALMS